MSSRSYTTYDLALRVMLTEANPPPADAIGLTLANTT